MLNVYENIVLPIQLDGRQPDQDYLNRIIETLGLGRKLQNLPNNCLLYTSLFDPAGPLRRAGPRGGGKRRRGAGGHLPDPAARCV